VEDRPLSTVKIGTAAQVLRVLRKEWIWTWSLSTVLVKELFGSPVDMEHPGGVDGGRRQVPAVFLLSLVQELPRF